MRRRDNRIHREDEAVARELLELRVPGEPESLGRALALAADERSRRRTLRRTPRRRIAAATTAIAALVAAIALTPAGATMRDWIGDAFDGAPTPTRTEIGRLPSGGSLLVQSAAGPWVVREDGSRRLLGDYDSATWSPNGMFVAVGAGRTLSAVEPDGSPRWSIDAPAPVRDARWSTSGQRIAYRSGGNLHVVAGDGTGDRVLATAVPPVAPSWKPAPVGALSPNVLAYVDDRGRLVTVDVDGGRRPLELGLQQTPLSIHWFDPNRLLVVGRRSLTVVDASSGRTQRVPVPGGDPITAADAAADGNRLAVLTRSAGGPASGGGGASSVLRLIDIADVEPSAETARDEVGSRILFSGLGRYDGPLFSPDGSRVLLGWRQADQWLFIRVRGAATPAPPAGDGGKRPDRLAVGDIARQFAPGLRPGAARFSRLEGWCCG